jgi:hypothetical protein
MRLTIPDLRIYLDEDDIESYVYGGNLEKAVTDSAVFFVFLSKDYFASSVCQEQILTAVRLGKPVIAIYEGDKFALESMINECKRFCTEDVTASYKPPKLSNRAKSAVKLDGSFFISIR